MKGIGGMQKLMQQANQMQTRMKKLQEELATREYQGVSGGGAVVAKVSGANQVLSIEIKKEIFESGDAELLQDMVKASVNDALKTAADTSQKEMQKVTGGLNIPGMF
jgi:DNA-binding YbaB/EbfC family protein